MKKRSILFYLIISIIALQSNAQKGTQQISKGFIPGENDTKSASNTILEINAAEIHQDKKNTLLKSANSTAELLDSIVRTYDNGDFRSKTIYEYDENGNRTLIQHHNWDIENKAWLNTNKYVYDYNSNGDQTLYETYKWEDSWICTHKTEREWGVDSEGNTTLTTTVYDWDSELEQLTPTQKQDFVYYNNSNTIKQRIGYLWGNDTWEPYSKLDQLYDNEGYDLTSTEYYWDSEINSYRGSKKVGYIYSIDKDYTKIMANFHWDENKWDWLTKTERENNEFGSILSNTEFIKEGDVWVPVSKIGYDGGYIVYYKFIDQDFIPDYKESTYYENNNLINRIIYNWDKNNQEWYLAYYLSNYWDYYYSSEDASMDTWKIIQKVELQYDNNGNEIARVQLVRNSPYDPWTENYTYKQISEYNENNQTLYSLVYHWAEEDWDDENPNKDSWIYIYRSDYYYSDQMATNTGETYAIQFQTYPNPVKNNLIVSGTKEGESIRIFDLNGGIIGVYKASTNETSIELGHLPNGIYMINIDGTSIKIVKE
ncbi:T9SS type A sorting domain-containing protein [Carboxylicivirga linearis]|uniref:T9SS type A sorting domain-containing protein n=1 Tax=Carboxylicivirga linearis TaxID=1628157 RepID=A0ABS5JX04_9BACT|nr:T9SS type A sorting domain-containing protein [Carboxylicivirga linearis]MBS2099412.1 T9SS type A sorting domain-containing protein [Carboxylicivirga linearis]